MKLSDYVADFLVHQQVRHLFLLPGGGCMHLADSVGKRPELDYVCCLHEQACAFAAEAVGEFAGELGCALVTAGPGGTNAVTGVACAWLESSPVLFISGQAKRADLITSRVLPVRSMGQQEVDIVAVVKPITKYAVTVLDPRNIRSILEEAVWHASQGRKGPVWVDIPLDVQAAVIEPADLPGFTPPSTTPAATDLCAAADEVAAALRSAKRPVLYVGNGVRSAGQIATLRALVARLGAPVLVTWKAIDYLPEDAPEFVGRPGGVGQRAANFAQQKCDLLLVLGARLDLPSVGFNHANIAPRARRIVVDVDPAELAKFTPPFQQHVTADLASFLPALLAAIATEADDLRARYSTWLALCRRWTALYPVVLPEHWAGPAGYVSTYALVDALADAAASDDIIVPGSSGPCSDILMQAWRVKDGQRILNAPGLGAMGTGLPGSIGACLAGDRRRVINLNGDGGFQLNIQELETIRRLALPIKFFVLDNDGYRSIVAMQRNHFQGRLVGSDPSSRLTLPDLRKIGPAYGIPTDYVDDVADIRDAIARTLALPGPAICVVKTSADEKTAPRVTAEVRPDGTIVSKPMEDMFPFLPRDEFEAIMAE